MKVVSMMVNGRGLALNNNLRYLEASDQDKLI